MNLFDAHLGILSSGQRALWPLLTPLRYLGFVLHGETAAALRLGHRDSGDFDFLTEKALDRDALLRAIHSLRKAPVLQDREGRYFAALNGVPVSFLGGVSQGRIGDPDLTADTVAVVASLRDLLAQKLRGVTQRLESRDYRDIAAILRHGENLAEGMGGASALFGASFSPAECLKALVCFKGGDLDTIPSADRATLLDAVRRLDWRNIPAVSVLSRSLQGN